MFRKIKYLDWNEFARKAEILEVFEFQKECKEHNRKVSTGPDGSEVSISEDA